MTGALQRLRFGYVPYSPSLEMPGDRRRFVHYARRRGLDFEIADPSKAYDVVVLSERADLSVWTGWTKGRIVYDLIDSYLAIPRTSVRGQLRGLAKFVSRQSRHLQIDHWKAVAGMCRRADAVVCTTQEQRGDIARYCSNVHVILDVHGSVAREVKTDFAAGPVFRLVWEGLGANVPSLELLSGVLRRIDARRPLTLVLVTDPIYHRHLGAFGTTRTEDVARRIFHRVEIHPWTEESCARIACSCDLAVIPLDADDAFARGKPENKLLLFWRMGIPTLTSSTPAYDAAMHAAGLDLTCGSERAWEDTLERCIASEDLRREAGEKGRRFAEAHHDAASVLARWDAVFASIG